MGLNGFLEKKKPDMSSKHYMPTFHDLSMGNGGWRGSMPEYIIELNEKYWRHDFVCVDEKPSVCHQSDDPFNEFMSKVRPRVKNALKSLNVTTINC